jgi:hypothetical protein
MAGIAAVTVQNWGGLTVVYHPPIGPLTRLATATDSISNPIRVPRHRSGARVAK